MEIASNLTPSLIGALVGGIITYYATTSSLRNRQNFELKRDAYFEYVKAIYLYRRININRILHAEDVEFNRLMQNFSDLIGPANFKIKLRAATPP